MVMFATKNVFCLPRQALFVCLLIVLLRDRSQKHAAIIFKASSLDHFADFSSYNFGGIAGILDFVHRPVF
jgi:hypothetical protein